MFQRPFTFHFLLAIVLAFGIQAFSADMLESGFHSPPDSAKPQTWWHWMNGNVSKEGITADLEAMKQIGLGGAEIFNADCGIPPGPVKFNSPQWHEMFTHAVREAGRLGLQLEAHNCAGWSSSGGPWNAPSNGMMHVVTSEIRVSGPTNFSGTLPEPPEKLDYYRDISVLAFPTPSGEGEPSLHPTVTASAAGVDAAPLVRNSATVTLPLPSPNHPQFIQFEFARPFAARTIQITSGAGNSNAKGVIQFSGDGVKFRECGHFALPHKPTRAMIFSLGGKPVTARFFRVVFNSLGNDAKNIALRGIEFSPQLRIEDFQTKDGDTGNFVHSMSDENEASAHVVLRRDKTIDLTAKLGADGKLNWKVPAGDWTILRAGFTPSGRDNHPAPAEGTGLECDKFSRAALDAHWAGFMQKLLDDAGPLAGKTFAGSVIDSYEVGGQNWSGNFRDEFQKRRGYDPSPFMPAFTGRVIETPQLTERFLWDVRRTIADLFAENYYGHFAELCHSNGLLASIEPYTGPFESLQCGQPADIVMGEFWSDSSGWENSSVKLAASVAHIYGKQLVGAESFTASPAATHGRWLENPASLKALGDLEYCTGLNRFIFHRYAMQPWTNRWPGMTMGQWGFHFERTETWWEQGKAWIDYVSRCQFLLQQGRYVADVAYFNGESAPSEMREGNPPMPPGYEFDAVNSDVLLHHATVKNGRLNLDGGASYAVLVLPPDDANLTPALLRRISDFVRDGLTVVGERPAHSPSLEDFPRCDADVKSLAKKLWGKCDGKTITENHFGRGRVIWGKSLADVFAELKLSRDFAFQGSDASKIVYCHRQLPDTEIYFVSNQRQQFDSVECSFRIAGKLPELWNAETGTIQPAPVWREENGRTIVPIQFDPAGSVFVIFRTPSSGDHLVSAEFHAKSAGKATPAELKILQATYGYFPTSSQTWSDVTEKVKSLMDKGAREIPANNDFAENDPAPSMPKQLRVEYILNGQNKNAEVNEGKSLMLPESATVVRAIYGKLPTAKSQTMDLTAKLASLVRDGNLSVRADNDLAGRDPANLTPKELRVEYSFDGKTNSATVAENETLTLPETAIVPKAAYEISAGENGTLVRSFVPGNFEALTSSGKKLSATVGPLPAVQKIVGPWQLNFPPNWGAPENVTLDTLISWSNHTNSGVKYFSGTAVYEKEIEIPDADLAQGRELWLDLGAVKNFAEVSLNEKSFGVLWKAPFRVNVTGAARPGKNSLQIKVTNLWPNRLIGDEQLPDDREWNGKQLKAWPQWLLDGKPSPTGRFTFTTWHHWTKSDALIESGLLGPVQLETRENVLINK